MTPSEPAAEPLADLLMRCTRTLRRRWSRLLEPWGLSPHQTRALRVLSTSEGPRLSELADALHVAPRSATEVVDHLAEKGLVRRDPDPADRRAIRLQLTEDGQQLLAEVNQARSAEMAEFFAPLSTTDRQDLSRILRHLLEATHSPRSGSLD
ncbi:MAG: MarR family winged helix-turn-helix transcriptional regulator [Propionibacteriaceae bacterium]